MFAGRLLAVILLAKCYECANILLLMALPSHSHHIWHVALVNDLAARGHNVTVLSTDIDRHAPPNVTYLHMNGVYDMLHEDEDMDFIQMHNLKAREMLDMMDQAFLLMCKGAMRSHGVQKLLAYPDSFRVDLILYDFASGPCLLGFQHKFGYPPVVAVTAFNVPTYTSQLLGGHNYFAYIPHFTVDYDMVMSFGQRLQNLYLHVYELYQRKNFVIPRLHQIAAQTFGDSLPYLGDLEQMCKLALVNSHPAIDYPEPLPPNVIAIGGLQVRLPKPLPADIEAFISSSRKAAVLFALGTNIRSDKLGLDKQLALLAAFKLMPEYNFLWKFESDGQLPADAIPANVMMTTWLPQNDILAHPRVRAFITHAGTLSMHEATWHAVPMVAIPFMIDQVRNSFKAIRDGVAERIQFPDISTELVERRVRQVLEDPSYRTNMDLRSARFRDQAETPLQRAVWWIEYVLRNPNPQHLQSPVQRIGVFVGNSGDMILGLILIAIVLTVAVCVGIWLVIGALQKRRVNISAKKSN